MEVTGIINQTRKENKEVAKNKEVTKNARYQIVIQ
jgi:hypothetical protein